MQQSRIGVHICLFHCTLTYDPNMNMKFLHGRIGIHPQTTMFYLPRSPASVRYQHPRLPLHTRHKHLFSMD